MTSPSSPNPPEDVAIPRPSGARTVAVMQPYFVPYGGYFRLFEDADLVVLYDCVQFPRRGYVHRNRLPDANGMLKWFTLPIGKTPRDTRICDLAFVDDAEDRLRRRAREFPSLAPLLADPALPLARQLFDLSMPPVDYITGWLETACISAGMPFRTIRSSVFDLPDDLRGENRIIEIVRHCGANHYLNAPGGRGLYDPARFTDAGIELAFLPEYDGPKESILHRLLSKDPVEIETRHTEAAK